MASTRQIGVASWSSGSATAGLARVVLAGVGLVVGDRRRGGARQRTGASLSEKLLVHGREGFPEPVHVDDVRTDGRGDAMLFQGFLNRGDLVGRW